MKTYRHCILTGISMLFCFLFFQAKAEATVWSNIRDGVVHIQIPDDIGSPVAVTVNWKDAWNSAIQTDHIYLQNPDGTLRAKYILNKANTPGETRFELEEAGIYRLEVTGACFRNISITVPSGIKTMFEPVKVHQSISLPPSGSLYFRVPKGQEFTFAAKDYDGASNYILSSPEKDISHRLDCKKHQLYSLFDQVSFIASPRPAQWRLRWRGKGKSSFWLDNIPNLFAQQAEDFFDISLPETTSHVRVRTAIIGTPPAIGTALPFATPPRHACDIMSEWHLSAANYYIFIDYLLEHQERAVDYKALYEQKFDIISNNAIFGVSGREPVLPATKEINGAICHYLRRSKQLPHHVTYYSIGDEPNLNYSSYDHFSRVFGEMATSIKTNPDKLIRNTRLAVPQSSRFLNGPTRDNAEDRIGIDWAEKLIDQYGEFIDAISWHEWLVRDLIDTNRYQEAVERADALIHKYHDRFRSRPALIIGQTNISSGHSLSRYENDTFFTALWWTSVVIQSSLPGKLQQLIWFKAADDGMYKKGLVTSAGNRFTEKPVSKAMTFITSHIGASVVAIENDHPELDLLATLSADKKKLMLLGVNKVLRRHRLKIDLPQISTRATLSTLSEVGSRQETFVLDDNHLELTIDNESIFALNFDIE